jgi:hypothetical protein
MPVSFACCTAANAYQDQEYKKHNGRLMAVEKSAIAGRKNLNA